MSDNTIIDAAIEAAYNAFVKAVREAKPEQDKKRTYARALIAKLLEGMEPPTDKTNPFQRGYNAALAEARRRAGVAP